MTTHTQEASMAVSNEELAQSDLTNPDPEVHAAFVAWRDSLPAKHWARHDLSACWVGFAAAARLRDTGTGRVQVKPLEWRDAVVFAAGDLGWLTIRIAETPFGQYRVEKADRHRFRVTLTGQVIANCHPTDDIEAQAAAQADYGQRIRSALAIKTQADKVTEAIDRRLYDLHVEALAEIKATVDGKSTQPVHDIIYGLLAEIEALPPLAALRAKSQPEGGE